MKLYIFGYSIVAVIFLGIGVKEILASSERGDLERVKDLSPPASVKTSSTKASSTLFHKGVLALNKGDNQQAVQFFSAWTKENPRSTAGWFNLGLSFYQQTQAPDPTRAYLRKVLFYNPYDLKTRSFLSTLEDKKPFWLWWPKDLFLGLMALSLLVCVIGRTKFPTFFQIVFLLVAHSLSGFYFYHRLKNHGTLTKDTSVWSAPSKEAPVLFEQKAGAFVVIKKESFKEWRHVQISRFQSGWVRSTELVPIKSNE